MTDPANAASREARALVQQTLYDALCWWGTLPEPQGDVPERYHRWDDLGEIADKVVTALADEVGSQPREGVEQHAKSDIAYVHGLAAHLAAGGVASEKNVSDLLAMARWNAEQLLALHNTAPTDQAQRGGEVERLREALKWALPLAERAMDDHRLERVRCGHTDISGTYANGVTWAGIWQFEVDQIEAARVALAQSGKGVISTPDMPKGDG